MKEPKPKANKNKILGVSVAVLNIIVLLIAWALGRVFPLPVCILVVIYFSIVVGMAISRYNVAKASGENTSKAKKEIQSNAVWVILIVLVLGFQVWSVGGFQPSSTSSGAETPAELASIAASEAKSSTTLPSEIDSVTTLTDITSEGNAIQYHYMIHDADTSGISTDSLRNSIQPNVCANTDTKDLLALGVDMQYSYIIKESGQQYSFTVSQSSC